VNRAETLRWSLQTPDKFAAHAMSCGAVLTDYKMSAHREHQFGRIALGMRGQPLAIREQQLRETEEQFQEIARQWLVKEQQIQELAALVQLKNQQLLDNDRELQLKDRQLLFNEQLLQTKEQLVQSKEQLLQAKEELLRKAEALITTKDQLLMAGELHVAEQETRLRSKDDQLQSLNNQCHELNQQLSVKQQHLDEVLHSRALRIGSTLTWPVRKLRHLSFRSAQAAWLDPNETVESSPLHEIAEDIVEADAPYTPPARNVGTLAIGVVTFNNSQGQLTRLLRSLELAVENIEEARIKVHLFVIDNGLESHWSESGITFSRLETQGNVGFGRGMNALMTTAFAEEDTEWFLCLNPDGVLHRGALQELLLSSKTHPDSLIEARQFPEEHVKPYDPRTLDTPWATGACLLIRRRLFEDLGGFDPNFFMYLEDIDLSWRARSAGFSIKVSPKALFGHAVLHRKPDASIDKSFLLSGRYLAFKWKNSEFRKWAERELVKRRHFQSRAELPELEEADTISTEINPELTDFKHYFHFSPPRW
jgi:GT2 family glycosyltransferase